MSKDDGFAPSAQMLILFYIFASKRSKRRGSR
jgi:hypothetical protein